MLYILILKCLERMLATVKSTDDIKVFEILIELYKFFKTHPPENLIVKYNSKLIALIIRFIINSGRAPEPERSGADIQKPQKLLRPNNRD